MTVIAVLFVALLALWFATEGDEEPAAAPPIAPVATIAERVAALRDLDFEEIPRPVAVTPDEARAEALEEFDAAYPPKRRRADEDVLKMLGLIEPDANLRDLAASLYGSGVAGYYNTKDGRLRTVSGAATGTRVLAEMVLAHELNHALEDQVYDLDVGEEPTTDDVSLARLALVEGTASSLMYGYVDEHFTAEEAVGGILGSAFQDTTGLPPFMQAQVLFPYVAGEEFVRELLRRGGGDWALVDTAYRVREPASTEQILHPRAYFEADEPKPVRTGAGSVLGDGWELAAKGRWGELQTRELLYRARAGGARVAAAGWGGDRYELWRPRAAVGDECPAPCADASVLVMRWRWDSTRDEDEFAAELRQLVDELGDREAVVVRERGTVTLVIAPGRTLAERVARAQPRRRP